MKNEKLLDVIGNIDDNLVHNAVHDNFKKKKPVWIKWGAVAACLVLVCVATISLFTGNNEETTTPGIADAPPMVYVNDTLYKQSTKQISYNELKDDFIYLGVIEKDISNLQGSIETENTLDGIPTENFQANHPIVGSEVYQYGNNIVVEIEGKYWLYEQYEE